ncbi:MAG: dockerin type I repeat-containing protein, partial [Dehalococcoidia bacterium]|nr:dockerin type I repeat-containing protein [Dehalococcoidia bacterium]
TPPDPQVAVGPDHVFEMVNILGRIFDKDGNEIDTFALADFFDVPPGYIDFDPKVIYDDLSGRWFASYVSLFDGAGADEGRLHLAISQTSDPTGAWNVYFVPYVDVFPDYAGIGVTDDKFTVSSNVFDIDGMDPDCGGGYCGEQTIVLQKSDVLAGEPDGMVGFVAFPIDPNRFTVRPAHSLSSTSDQYLTTWDLFSFDQLTVIRITGTPDDGNVMEASATNLTTLFQDSPPVSDTAGVADCIVFGMNLGPPPCIDSGDFRVLETIWRDDSLWNASSAECMPPGDVALRSCAHLVEVETLGAPSVTQDVMAGASGEYYSWPAIRTDASGNLVASVTRTTPSIFAQARVIGREAGDPPNTLSGSNLLRAGEVVHISGRWGDYLGAAVDPSDPSCVWLVGEYAKDTIGSDWGTYIAGTTYSGDDCAGAPVTPTPTDTPPAKDCGDVNDDGAVTSVDAALILQLVAGLVGSLPNEPSADVNGDGDITSVDAALVLQLQAGFIDAGDLNCP